MATTLLLINNKGGVAKTTSVFVIAEILAYIGKRILVIDNDPQSNLSMQFNRYVEDTEAVEYGFEYPQEENYNIAELFQFRYKDKDKVERIIRKTDIERIDIIPSSQRHKNTIENLNKNPGVNSFILKKALDTVSDNYDYIIIDSAPASDILTVNNMFASDYIACPVRTEGYSYKGLKETLAKINYLRKEYNITNAKFVGTFFTQAETGTNVYKDLKNAYMENLEGNFLQTPIRKDIKISEVESNFESLLEYCPNTNSIFDYSNLILEMGILDDESAKLLKAAIGEC